MSTKPTDTDFFDPEQWISAKELAAMLGITPHSLYNKISAKQDFPASYPVSDRCTRFFKPDVKAWLLSRRREFGGADAAALPVSAPNVISKPWLTQPRA